MGSFTQLLTLLQSVNMVDTPKKAPAAKKPKAKPTHPPTSAMIAAAIKALKERNGSSLAAIKKYIAATYKVDVVKLAPFIRKALKKGVEAKKLIKVKASYKLAKEEKKPKAKKPKAKKPKAKKPKAKKVKKSPKKAAKKPAAKKAKTPKKAAKPAAKKPAAKKTPKKAAAKKPAAKKPAAKKPAAKKTPKKAAPKKK